MTVDMSVYTCNDTLAACFLVTCSTVHLTSKEQVLDNFRFECMLELGRVEVVVFYGISRAVKHHILKARNLLQSLKLDVHR